MSRSPRGAMHSCPRRLAALFDTKARSGHTHHHKDLAPATGRQDHTILPYAGFIARCARGSRSRLSRPAGPKVAPMKPASTAVRPAFVTIAIRPSSLGRSETTHTTIPNFGKAEYFRPIALTAMLGVLPDGQRKMSWPRSARIRFPPQPSRSTLPGFMMLPGSIVRLIARMMSSSVFER